MRCAIAQNGDKVALVFDYAHQLRIIDIEGGTLAGNREVVLDDGLILPLRAARLAALGVEVLICGAISRPLAAMAAHSGIEIISNVAGDIDEVVNAFVLGRLVDRRYALPGCMPGGPHACGRGGGAGVGVGRRGRRHGNSRR